MPRFAVKIFWLKLEFRARLTATLLSQGGARRAARKVEVRRVAAAADACYVTAGCKQRLDVPVLVEEARLLSDNFARRMRRHQLEQAVRQQRVLTAENQRLQVPGAGLRSPPRLVAY